MAFCACKCLNISIKCDSALTNVDIGKIELSAIEQRDAFFREELLSTSLNVKLEIVQPTLLKKHDTGNWLLHSCLACGQTAYASQANAQAVTVILVNKRLQTTEEKMEEIKKSESYSPLFKILVPEVTNDSDAKEDINKIDLNETRSFTSNQHVIGSLSRQLTRTLQAKLEAVEEAVRQYRDMKYAEFEVFRERAHRDHKALASIINKARTSPGKENISEKPNEVETIKISPQLPPLQRRRLSASKDMKKIKHNIDRNARNASGDELFIDSEDIFDLEGMANYAPHNGILSDADDSDSDNSGSHDEGIHIARKVSRNTSWTGPMAKSLPMNVPRFMHNQEMTHDDDDEEEPEDIAASIKALARSVHGDVFGDLPRPRFSTQI